MTVRRIHRRLGALPIRLRLVAGFVVAITIVLTAAGAFVYWRVSYALDLRLDNDLRADVSALAPLVSPQGTVAEDAGLQRTSAGRLYQVLDGNGAVLVAGDQLGTVPVLPSRSFRTALDREVIVDVGALLPRSRRPLRLIAVPVQGDGPARVLVVAQRRDGRDEALRELLAQLALAGAGALLVTAVVGERLAKAALAPVERYRAQAARIASGDRGVRLDVPDGRDDEVTRLGHTLNEVLAALEQTVARERRFTQDASHELRTPLTLLSTRVQLALARPRSVPEHEAVLHELGEDIGALSALARRLLSLSTVTDGGDTTAVGADLAAVVSSVVLRTEANLDMPPGAATAPVDMPDAQVRQVLGNLLDNAAAHGEPPCVVSLAVRQSVAVLVVHDDGPGIDHDFLPLAAGRFARSAAARARPGAGLGLSLVQTLVDHYGGELRLCSAGVHHRYAANFDVPCQHPASGTSASVLLPIVG